MLSATRPARMPVPTPPSETDSHRSGLATPPMTGETGGSPRRDGRRVSGSLPGLGPAGLGLPPGATDQAGLAAALGQSGRGATSSRKHAWNPILPGGRSSSGDSGRKPMKEKSLSKSVASLFSRKSGGAGSRAASVKSGKTNATDTTHGTRSHWSRAGDRGHRAGRPLALPRRARVVGLWQRHRGHRDRRHAIFARQLHGEVDAAAAGG